MSGLSTIEATTAQQILSALHGVKDPEIPSISVVDMGIVRNVLVQSNAVTVTITPTFVGCPAIATMRSDIEATIRNMGYSDVTVEVNFDEPWTTNLISDAGRAALLVHGLAPPEPFSGTLSLELEVLNNIACPVCRSRDTTLTSPFGPTLCRSIHHCNACGETFEAFKPV